MCDFDDICLVPRNWCEFCKRNRKPRDFKKIYWEIIGKINAMNV